MKEETENSGSQWANLVNRIQNGETDGMEELHRLLSQEIRSYLSPQIGPQGLEERLRDALALVIQAIRRGEVREPERLLDFVLTVVNRQATGHTDWVVHAKAEEIAIESAADVIYAEGFPARGAMRREEEVMMKRVLGELSDRAIRGLDDGTKIALIAAWKSKSRHPYEFTDGERILKQYAVILVDLLVNRAKRSGARQGAS